MPPDLNDADEADDDWDPRQALVLQAVDDDETAAAIAREVKLAERLGHGTVERGFFASVLADLVRRAGPVRIGGDWAYERLVQPGELPPDASSKALRRFSELLCQEVREAFQSQGLWSEWRQNDAGVVVLCVASSEDEFEAAHAPLH